MFYYLQTGKQARSFWGTLRQAAGNARNCARKVLVGTNVKSNSVNKEAVCNNSQTLRGLLEEK